MKKILLFLIAIIFGISLVTSAQIPNAGFENWTGENPDDWACSNLIPAGFTNITPTNDMHSGTYALRGEVSNFFGTPITAFVQSGSDAAGFGISEQYHLFEIYYKFTSFGGDKFSVNVALEKGGIPIAQGAVAIPTTIDSYTHLSVPLTYTVDQIPDVAIIQISITGPVTGPDVHLGSVMFIDDLSFSIETGTEDLGNPDLAVKCFPNPASDMINIQLDGNLQGDIVLKVFDIFGKEVKSLAVQQQQPGNGSFRFSVGDLSSGLYFYSVNGQSGHYTGKFNVNR